MSKEVREITRVVETVQVVFEGVLNWEDGSWRVEDERLESWEEKFEGKRVRLTIELLDPQDDAGLEGGEVPSEGRCRVTNDEQPKILFAHYGRYITPEEKAEIEAYLREKYKDRLPEAPTAPETDSAGPGAGIRGDQ